MADSLAPDAVRPLLRGRFGKVYRYAEVTPSTQRMLGEDSAEIMQGIGIAVAIPAVLAYNVFGKRVAASEAELEGFAHDLREMITDTAGQAA